MEKVLFIIDAQNDFCSKGGSLVCDGAEKTVENICHLLDTVEFDKIICTKDFHREDYLDTNEGKKLPVKHCIEGTWGYELNKAIYDSLYGKNWESVTKDSFMMDDSTLVGIVNKCKFDCEFYVCGFATDICVLNNVLLLNRTVAEDFYSYTPLYVISNCCSGTTSKMHDMAFEIMEANLIDIITLNQIQND